MRIMYSFDEWTASVVRLSSDGGAAAAAAAAATAAVLRAVGGIAQCAGEVSRAPMTSLFSRESRKKS